jgi:hypothetical protein
MMSSPLISSNHPRSYSRASSIDLNPLHISNRDQDTSNGSIDTLNADSDLMLFRSIPGIQKSGSSNMMTALDAKNSRLETIEEANSVDEALSRQASLSNNKFPTGSTNSLGFFSNTQPPSLTPQISGTVSSTNCSTPVMQRSTRGNTAVSLQDSFGASPSDKLMYISNFSSAHKSILNASNLAQSFGNLQAEIEIEEIGGMKKSKEDVFIPVLNQVLLTQRTDIPGTR